MGVLGYICYNHLERVSSMILPNDVLNIIENLESAGYETWAVGGCVRDSLLGLTPKDYDVATSCPFAVTNTLFPRTVKTGEAYGTITVLTPSIPVEVTSFRLESHYADSRHPENVLLAHDIITDLSRRDLTINAMAWHPKRGLCDPFGGKADLQKRVTRAVGDPNIRFKEDALRILRCLRFASELDFDIEINTLESIKNLAPTLKNISAERISCELGRLLAGVRPQLCALAIEYGGLADFGLEHIKQPDLLCRIPDSATLRLAGLLWLSLDDKSDAKIQSILCRMRLDNRTIHKVKSLLSGLDITLPTDAAALKRKFSILKPEIWGDILSLRSVLLNEDNEEIYQLLSKISGQPWNRSMLDISGDDLHDMGYDNRMVGEVLQALTELVLYHPELNTKDALLNQAKDYNSLKDKISEGHL